MIITFLLVRVFRLVEKRYLRHLEIDGGKAGKTPGKVAGAAAGMPQMR